MSGFKKLK